jgi:hypothetical protein
MGISVCGEEFKAGGERRVFWIGDRCIPLLSRETGVDGCLLGLKVCRKSDGGGLRSGLRES